MGGFSTLKKQHDPMQSQITTSQQLQKQADMGPLQATSHEQLVREGTAKIQRHKLAVTEDLTLTDEEWEELLKGGGQEPPGTPEFVEKKSFRQRMQMKKAERKEYKKKYKAYQTHLATKQHEQWEERERERVGAFLDVISLRREEEARFPGDIPPDPAAMDEALRQGNRDYDDILKNYGQRHVEAWDRYAKSLGLEKAHKGISRYAGGEYIDINNYLRFGQEICNSKLKEDTDHALKAIQHSHLGHTMVTRRSAGSDCLKFMLGCKTDGEAAKMLRKFRPDGPSVFMEDKAFCSTAVGTRDKSSDSFRYDVEMVMRLPKGLNAIPISETKLEQYKGEREILLGPGTKFRILKVDELNKQQQKEQYGYDLKTSRPRWRIYLEAISQNDSGTPAP